MWFKATTPTDKVSHVESEATTPEGAAMMHWGHTLAELKEMGVTIEHAMHEELVRFGLVSADSASAGASSPAVSVAPASTPAPAAPAETAPASPTLTTEQVAAVDETSTPGASPTAEPPVLTDIVAPAADPEAAFDAQLSAALGEPINGAAK